MNQVVLIDTGPLVALLDRRDQYHAWAVEQMSRLRPPSRTCEAVIAEAFHLLRHFPNARAAILEMAADGALTTPFQLCAQAPEILALVKKYSDVPMALADACLVRMSELMPNSVVLTLDSDFRIYRRHKRQKIPLLIPPEV
jgi:predicted nucleic acid-binding protein